MLVKKKLCYFFSDLGLYFCATADQTHVFIIYDTLQSNLHYFIALSKYKFFMFLLRMTSEEEHSLKVPLLQSPSLRSELHQRSHKWMTVKDWVLCLA